MELVPGENDVSRLPAGVYFVVRRRPGGQGVEGPSQKVVISH